jgi:tRNA nucleotidyltransferase (CCA-adding enzyme)
MSEPKVPIEDLAGAMHRTFPELEPVRAAGIEGSAYLVGGAVRDLLLGRERHDIDLVVVGNLLSVLGGLGGTLVGMGVRGLFNTASVQFGDHRFDLAEARTEVYPRPGALPIVEPASTVEADLVRRDFTVNAMAIPLAGNVRLIDPHGGLADLERGWLRVLHPRSLVDDPTRAIRAARYAARLGFEPEPETAKLLGVTDLGTISADRRDNELKRLAGEASAPRGFELLAQWGLIEPREGGIELARKLDELLDTPAWCTGTSRSRAIRTAVLGPVDDAAKLATVRPGSPSEAVELIGGREPDQLIIARALGAEWLDRYMEEWRSIELEIDGSDLLAAGVPEGPAVGRGLRAALRRKLDGEIGGREQELAVALEAARGE